jgi:hypothetical protein
MGDHRCLNEMGYVVSAGLFWSGPLRPRAPARPRAPTSAGPRILTEKNQHKPHNRIIEGQLSAAKKAALLTSHVRRCIAAMPSKVRFKSVGKIGVASLRWDRSTGRYSEIATSAGAAASRAYRDD